MSVNSCVSLLTKEDITRGALIIALLLLFRNNIIVTNQKGENTKYYWRSSSSHAAFRCENRNNQFVSRMNERLTHSQTINKVDVPSYRSPR